MCACDGLIIWLVHRATSLSSHSSTSSNASNHHEWNFSLTLLLEDNVDRIHKSYRSDLQIGDLGLEVRVYARHSRPLISLARKDDRTLLPHPMHSTDMLPATVPVPVGADGSPTPSWRNLRKFNTLSVYNLRHLEGTFPHAPGFFDAYHAKFNAADIAWWAAGTQRDGQHDHANNAFHAMYHEFMETGSSPGAKADRKALLAKMQALLWDIVCHIYLVFFLCL